jgi:hypothetical protein
MQQSGWKLEHSTLTLLQKLPSFYTNIFLQYLDVHQGTHFINDAIKYLIDHFISIHTSSTVYYPQGNGHAKSINKVFGTLLTKLANENRNY